MSIYRLSNESSEAFSEKPELGMGLQIGALGDDLFLILYGEIALEISSKGAKDFVEAIAMLLNEYTTEDGFANQCLHWRTTLSTIEPNPFDKQTPDALSPQHFAALIAFVMPTAPIVPAPPTPPSYIYGHLPFTGTTSVGDRFLRFEPWPTSRRLNQTLGTVQAGTYAAPASERQLVPNGFAAVGRYALPNLLPACTVWEIIPQPRTILAVGTSVPLYGQAGGGAEVCFQAQQTAAISKLPSLPVL